MDRRSINTWAFSVFVCLVGGATALWAATATDPLASRPFQLGWPVLVAAFVLAERYAVHLEVRREAHTIAFSEVPLTIGLIFADPDELVLARVIAAVVTVAIVRRLPPVKLVYNAGQFALDVGVAVLVFHAVLGNENPVEPLGWIAGLAAIAASHVVGALAVSSVMRIAGAPVTLKSQVAVVTVSFSAAIAGAAVALGASGALWKNSWSWILLLLIGGALGYFFISFIRIRERHRDLATLHGFTTSLATNTDPLALGEVVAVGLADLLRSSRVVVLLPAGHDVIQIEFRNGETTLTRSDDPEDPQSTTPRAVSARLMSQLHTGSETFSSRLSASALTVPLPLPDEPGLIAVDDRLSAVRPFDAEDVQLLETAAGHAASAIHNAQLVDKLREEARFRAHQALHDDVTDLPNQRALLEQLDSQLDLGTRLVMLTARIHSLREVNETLGRSMGDEMLRQVAARLRPIGRRSWCARSGTDEFTLVVPGGQDESDDLAARLVEAFDQPVLCNDVALAVTVGVGVALAPQHGTEAEMLLRRASLAASRSALDGTTVTTWASDRDPYDPQRLTIAADLRDAIPNGELSVHFQPQLDMASGLITSVEALVRWDHPRLGYLRPDQFINAAENTGAIDALTYHVLEVAATAGARWHDLGWDLDMAVNLSARNLTSPHFVDSVEAILERTGLPASSLTLELTESSVMTEAERALKTLHDLHGLGIALSIDDFGTGYSSLAHLRRLPVGEIKIDKSFVFDLTTSESDEAIVRSMVELGHNLGLTVVVEGVETVEVRNRLQELGSDRLQGYLLSRPLSAEAFETWVSERKVRPLRVDPSIGRVVNLDRHR